VPISVPKFVFGLPPEDIIKWFEKKGYAFSWNWRDLWQDEHVRAFTVAKAMKLDILESIRKELNESMKSGMLFSDFQRKLEPKLKKLGWWGKIKAEDVPGYDPASGIDPDKEVWLGSPWRLVTIYNTNVDTAYSAGRWRGQKEAALTHPYLQYIAVMDDRTRDEHAALDGKVFHINDPFWNYFYPPNGWNCRCRVRSLTEKQVKERKLHVEQTGPNNFGFDEFINPDGSVDRTAWYGGKMKKTSTERGWSYNPGKVDWEPDLNKYPKQLADLYRNNPTEEESLQKEDDLIYVNTLKKYFDQGRKYLNNYDRVGIRIISKDHDGYDTLKVGDIAPNSYRWEEGDQTSDMLDGTSAIDINEDVTKGNRGGYMGSKLLVLGTNDNVEWGEDLGEIVMRNAEILEIINL